MSTTIPPEPEKTTGLGAENTSESKAQNLTRQGGVVAGMTLLSRISGLMRDIVLSYLFGASAVADMFFVAFRIPNFFRRLFAEGAFSQAFVPVLMQYKAKGHKELTYFVAGLSGLFGIVLLGFVALGVVFASGLTALFAPGFIDQPEQFSATTELVRITFSLFGFYLAYRVRRLITQRPQSICITRIYACDVEFMFDDRCHASADRMV